MNTFFNYLINTEKLIKTYTIKTFNVFSIFTKN